MGVPVENEFLPDPSEQDYFHEQCFLTASGKFKFFKTCSEVFLKRNSFYLFAKSNKLFSTFL